jgi:uncharacterized protein (TIGR02145 family)
MKKSAILILSVFFISIIVLFYGCKKGDLSEISTVEVTGITNNSAVSGGTIISDGGCDITEKGVCWNTTGNPVIETDQKTSNGEGSDNFTSNITGLEPAKTYYLRAYATNDPGTSYGEEITFTTKIADADGNLYNTIKIGNQVWMAENLKTTKYNDNTAIPLVTDNTAWTTLTTAAYSWADNNEAQYKDLYGAFYNWYAVETAKLCPSGWHVPTDADFKTLEISLGMTQEQADAVEWRGTDQGKKMKNTTGWLTGGNGTNTSGFSAMPSGYRAYATGTSDNLGTLCYWWTATQSTNDIATYRRLDGNKDAVYRNGTYKKAGKAVRCVKN